MRGYIGHRSQAISAEWAQLKRRNRRPVAIEVLVTQEIRLTVFARPPMDPRQDTVYSGEWGVDDDGITGRRRCPGAE